MNYQDFTEEQLQTERQNIMDEITRRNDLVDIPKQAEEMALRFEALGGNKSDLAQIVNDAKAEEPSETAQKEKPGAWLVDNPVPAAEIAQDA